MKTWTAPKLIAYGTVEELTHSAQKTLGLHNGFVLVIPNVSVPVAPLNTDLNKA
jgi:hypothetical protein